MSESYEIYSDLLAGRGAAAAAEVRRRPAQEWERGRTPATVGGKSCKVLHSIEVHLEYVHCDDLALEGKLV